MREAASLTPMLRQYRALKHDHPDAILLFRMGDFYEMFYEDARLASRLLELTLTARGKGTANVVPMCGFPHHQVEAYTARLVGASQRVAVCEQVEDPRQAKGLVKREVVRVVTPGTVTDPAQLEAKANSWMASVCRVEDRTAAAFLDLSTGEFLAWESGSSGSAALEELFDRLRVFAPREIVHPEDADWLGERSRADAAPTVLTRADSYGFTETAAAPSLRRQLGVASLDGFGFRDRPAAIGAAGGLLQYLQDTQKCGLEHIDRLQLHEPSDYLLLDPATRRNLEIERSARDGERRNSLFGAVDSTLTPGGGRLLRRWLLQPLRDPERVAERLDTVEEFVGQGGTRDAARDRLSGVRDVERLLARCVAGLGNPRDLEGLRVSLERIPSLVEALSALRAPLLRGLLERLDPCADVAARLAGAIVDDPPASLRDGGVIRDGFHVELDELRAIRRDGRAYIASLEAAEREATGIASLKVKFNKVFGYFIEVSKSNLHLVPESYQRKQTIAGGERYITPELKGHESKVLNAQERIESLETELFHALRSEIAGHAPRLKAVGQFTATVDVLSGLAETAVRHDYRRPGVDTGNRLQIVGGRHPVVEQALVEDRFVPNDTDLDAGGKAIAVLTGPNMGGKSTYLRQVALIVLLAQSGSFVPAESAQIGIVDRIFCRVGASDSLAEGQSTFMVEMSETANILHNATPRSLVLLDEIGRGTSTFDGLSIAWAVLEHLQALEGGAPRSLFATHYHELTETAVTLSGVLNLRMAVRGCGDDVVFLHLVERGAADRSYGIQVARLAGVPHSVVERAREILDNLERDEYGRDGLPRRARSEHSGGAGPRRLQASLFDAPPAENAVDRRRIRILDELSEQQPDRLTPMEALEMLHRWRRELDEETR